MNQVGNGDDMQRIMIVSDTHGRHGNLMEALYREGSIDKLIHLGDFQGEEDVIMDMAGCESVFVAGNNDFWSPYNREETIELGKYRALLTHGHSYYVTNDLHTIREEGLTRGFDIVMFGHTHIPVIDIRDQITLINPGSISYPRQDNHLPTYIMLEIDQNGELSFELKSL